MAHRTPMVRPPHAPPAASRHPLSFMALALALAAFVSSSAGAAVPPVPTQPSPACDAVVGGRCYVNGAFTISAFSAGAHHYRVCRSNDTTGWGGCNSVISFNTGSSITVSGANLPSDGFRRAFYFSACDAADACTAWGDNPEAYVQMDLTGPSAPGGSSVACAYASGDNCWVTGNFTVSVAPASDGGSGVGSYNHCRSHDSAGGFAGCNVTLTPSGGTSFTVSGTNLPSDGLRRAFYVRARDQVGNYGSWNSPRYVRVDRHAPTVSASGASAGWKTSATAVVQAADTTAGAAANAGLQHVRYRWDVALNGACTNGTAIAAGGSLAAPEGDHRLYLCARDRVGRVQHWNGQYRIDSGPPSAPGATTVACNWTSSSPNDCWIRGAFVASVTPATDGSAGVSGYRICRSNDVTGWGGCNADLVGIGSGGTSITVSGTHLPADGFRRAYYFQARDHAGNWGAWNTPRFVRIDRYKPTVSATGASTAWVTSATATISAADTTAGAAANSGLAQVRYRWNGPTNGACTNGTATSVGATLTAPEGDNLLYLCARDQTGRVGSWAGTYRVDNGPPTAPGPTTIACSWTTASPNDCWVAGAFVASVTPATDAGTGIDGYRICRSNDVTGWGGCQADLVPIGSGGTSVTVSGAHLPGDGFRRAYYFQARDNSGIWGPWNTPRFVRIDRHDPVVSASGASTAWAATATATVSAADSAGGAGVNSGLVEVRYRWNAPTNAACTNGTVTTVGVTLTAPEGDGTLYLCARDQTGRVGSWNGSYRVDTTAPTLDSLTVSDSFWSIGDGSVYQITARASDAGSGVRELRALINYQGDNAANRRGNYSWRDQSLGYLWTADQVPCTGGGFASKHPSAFNPQTATLVGCTSSLVGSQRTVTFSIRPEASFGEFGPVNDVSFWARDFRLLARGWQNFDLNFASSARPPAKLQVRDDAGAALPHNGNVGWGTLENGANNGAIAKTMTVKNIASVGSANLVLEHSPSNVELVGSSAFSIVGTLVSPLAVGQQDTFQVRLDTTQTGSHSAVLKIWHSDPVRPLPLRINLSATVNAPPVPEPVVTAVERDPILQGQTKILIVRGSNLSGASVSIATLPVEGGTPARIYPTAELVSINTAGTRMEVRVNASAAGIEGFYNIAVETPGGSTAAQFRVVGPAPVIDVWTPSEPIAGRVHVLQVMGENLGGANVVPMTAGVRILELDNSNAKSLSGLMFVSSTVPPGGFDLRIDGTSGSTMLPMELRPDIRAATQRTRMVDTGPARAGAVRPQIVLQDPISAYGPEDIARMFGVGPDDELPSSVSRDQLGDASRNHICLTFGARRTFSFSAVLLSLFDGAGDPLVIEAVNALLPGQGLDFTSLTLAVTGFIQFDFLFQICENGITDLRFCIRGGIAVMVPLVGGWSLNFDFCFGINQQQTLAGAGRIDGHTYITSNGCVQASDTEPPGFQSGQRRGRVDVSCCEDATISLRTSGVVFETPFVAEGPVLETELVCSPTLTLNLRIKEVSFLDDLAVKRDQVGSAPVIMDPVWSDPDLDGVPAVADNGVAYVRETQVRAIAKLVANPPPMQPQMVRIRVTSPQGLTLESQDVSVDSGEIQVELISVGTVSDTTQKYRPLQLDWGYSIAGGELLAAGRTEHPFYVTLAPPQTGPQRHLTMTALDLGTIGGVSTPSTAALQAWAQFAGPGNVRTWSGRALSYYPQGSGFEACQSSALGLLQSPTGNAQCGAFAELLIDALAAHGIDARKTRVEASDGTNLLIKNWQFQTASFPATSHPWKLQLVAEVGSFEGMVPAPAGNDFGDLVSISGIAAQNSTMPSEKAFDKHFVVFVPVPGLTHLFYDPSYGQSFADPADFQARAVAGFYKRFSGDPARAHRVRQAGTGLNITFTVDTGVP